MGLVSPPPDEDTKIQSQNALFDLAYRLVRRFRITSRKKSLSPQPTRKSIQIAITAVKVYVLRRPILLSQTHPSEFAFRNLPNGTLRLPDTIPRDIADSITNCHRRRPSLDDPQRFFSDYRTPGA